MFLYGFREDFMVLRILELMFRVEMLGFRIKKKLFLSCGGVFRIMI